MIDVVYLWIALMLLFPYGAGITIYAYLQDMEIERWVKRSDNYQAQLEKTRKYLSIQVGIIKNVFQFLEDRNLTEAVNTWWKIRKEQVATAEPDAALVSKIAAAMGAGLSTPDVVVEHIPPEKVEVLVPTSHRLGFLR